MTVVAERPNIAGHEYVEMGDGLKWATRNMGAYNPWEYGDYYAWGATVPFYLTEFSLWIDGKTGYNWFNYPFMHEGYINDEGITKYTIDDGLKSSIWYDGDGNFIGDNKTSFADYGYADDAARQRWGGTWRIPTEDEWTTLRNTDLYTWVWTTDYLGTGKNGMLVTRKADTGPYSGNSIFLPAASHREDASLGNNVGQTGYYWSSSLSYYSRNARDLLFYYIDGDLNGVYRDEGPRLLRLFPSPCIELRYRTRVINNSSIMYIEQIRIQRPMPGGIPCDCSALLQHLSRPDSLLTGVMLPAVFRSPLCSLCIRV